MNHRKQYNTTDREMKGQILYYKPYPDYKRKRISRFSVALQAILIVVIFAAVVIWAAGRAEDVSITCWALCKPGDRVNLRMKPDKDSREVGWLECGDSFQTDGTNRNGWIRVLDAGECECWIYSGYVVTEEPEVVGENYVCVSRNRVACRRWVDGPQIRINGRLSWLKNGSCVSVFYIAGEWAVTSRGYIKAEWLEVDPV